MIDKYYFITILFIAFILSICGTVFYKKLAIKKNILADLNNRTLHDAPTPRGGGIVFASVFIVFIILFWKLNKLPDDLFFVLGVGGAIALVLGFLDDIFELGAKKKLAGHFLLSSWLLFWFNGGPLLTIDWVPSIIAIPLTLLLLVWIINAYNFMDGIDGMAISGAVFVSGSFILVMLITGNSSFFLILSTLLFVCTSAFMIFNWPPASIFMGDTGSIFLGYFFGAQITYTIMYDEISIYTWLIIFSYFIADTTATQIARMLLLIKWTKAHRSHAYQNIARITNSHFKVTLGVMVYSLFWVLPLLIWSVREPVMAGLASFFSMLPAFIVSFKYGPFFSQD